MVTFLASGSNCLLIHKFKNSCLSTFMQTKEEENKSSEGTTKNTFICQKLSRRKRLIDNSSNLGFFFVSIFGLEEETSVFSSMYRGFYSF